MTKQELYEFRTGVTAKISEICRFIGLGLIAVFYTIKTGSVESEFDTLKTFVLYFVGTTGVTAILLDYVQYVNNYRVVEKAIESEALLYDEKSRHYKVAEFCFHWKQRVTLAGAVALIALVLLS